MPGPELERARCPVTQVDSTAHQLEIYYDGTCLALTEAIDTYMLIIHAIYARYPPHRRTSHPWTSRKDIMSNSSSPSWWGRLETILPLHPRSLYTRRGRVSLRHTRSSSHHGLLRVKQHRIGWRLRRVGCRGGYEHVRRRARCGQGSRLSVGARALVLVHLRVLMLMLRSHGLGVWVRVLAIRMSVIVVRCLDIRHAMRALHIRSRNRQVHSHACTASTPTCNGIPTIRSQLRIDRQKLSIILALSHHRHLGVHRMHRRRPSHRRGRVMHVCELVLRCRLLRLLQLLLLGVLWVMVVHGNVDVVGRSVVYRGTRRDRYGRSRIGTRLVGDVRVRRLRLRLSLEDVWHVWVITVPLPLFLSLLSLVP